MEAASPVYLEIIDFIAAGTTPETVVSYRPSAELERRVAELIAREKDDSLTPEERAELDERRLLQLLGRYPRHVG
jgi:hypothetical protein